MRRERPSGGGLGLFIVGAFVGAATALLLAPESGDESRKRLGHWLHEHGGVSGHDLYEKLKGLLHVRHNGVGELNGRTSLRRHRRGS